MPAIKSLASEAAVWDTASFFRITKDTTRVRILLLLKDRKLCVCQLMGALGLSQPRISQQLAVLMGAKLVTYSKVGKWNYYRIDPDLCNNHSLATLMSSLPHLTDGNKQFESDLVALKACLKLQKETGCCNIKSFEGIRAKIEPE